MSLASMLVAASAVIAAQNPPPKAADQAPAAAPAKKRPKKKAQGKTGIPKGTQACLDRLNEIASAEPLPEYGGQAEKIINEGLLWNDPKSKCSIGSDQALRSKVSAVVTAWRQKDAGKVRSLLQELKSAAPSSSS